MLTGLHVVYSYFYATIAELSHGIGTVWITQTLKYLSLSFY
jgi:hypothetical protein